jgi:hypothetical protein
MILAYFCPPRVLFVCKQLDKIDQRTLYNDKPNNLQAFWVVAWAMASTDS